MQVLAKIREKGLSDPETMELVINWTKQEEERVTQEGTSEATIGLNIARADLYVAAGDIEGALDCLESARVEAHNEGLQDLFDAIMKKMDELESSEESR